MQTREPKDITTIIKRDGSTQPYDYEKIVRAIQKAFTAVYPELATATIVDYTMRVANATSTWLRGTAESDTLHTEEIQDTIEDMLMQLHFHDVAKAFILYRAEHSKLRAGELATDIIGTYLDKSDWRVRENSNSGYCYASLMNHVAGTMIANYCLENVYSHDVAKAHIDGDIHLHDLSAGVVGYCFVGSTKIMVANGEPKSFEELMESDWDTIPVMSIDGSGDCVKCPLAEDVRITRYVTETLTITFSDGSKVECTPDHLFMISDDPIAYERADKLIRYTEDGHPVRKSVIALGRVKKKVFNSQRNSSVDGPSNVSIEYPYIEDCRCERRIVVPREIVTNTYEEPIPVYDLTVPKYHNFALETGIMVHNCAGWSIRDVLMKGFIGKYGRANAGPAKHLDTALLQSANYLCTLQTEWAGAQAFNSFDTFMAPFVRHDALDYDSVKQRVQQFVFGLNIASRYGQCPFTNLTFDLACPEDMKNQPVIIGGELQDTTYSDYQNEMDMINKAFIEVMMNGDKDGRIFSFPIPTYNITPDFPWDSEVATLLFKMTGKLGAPYFQNFINTDLNPSDVRSMCCRLRLDLTDIRKHTGGLFGAGDQTGSIGVVSINVPRIAYLAARDADPKDAFYRLYDSKLTLAKKALEAKRREINKNFDNGLMPYSQEYLPHKFTRHFSTIGVIGFNEAMRMLLGKTMGDEEAINFVKEVISYTLKRCEEFTKETGNMYNFEAVPGEGLSYRFAKIDKKKYPDIITAGSEETPYYTNSSQLPVNYTNDPFEALELQGDIQSMYSSGTVLHFYIGECIDDEKVVAKFVKNVCNKSKLPFFSLTPEFSICPKCGYLRGVHETCPNHC